MLSSAANRNPPQRAQLEAVVKQSHALGWAIFAAACVVLALIIWGVVVAWKQISAAYLGVAEAVTDIVQIADELIAFAAQVIGDVVGLLTDVLDSVDGTIAGEIRALAATSRVSAPVTTFGFTGEDVTSVEDAGGQYNGVNDAFWAGGEDTSAVVGPYFTHRLCMNTTVDYAGDKLNVVTDDPTCSPFLCETGNYFPAGVFAPVSVHLALASALAASSTTRKVNPDLIALIMNLSDDGIPSVYTFNRRMDADARSIAKDIIGGNAEAGPYGCWFDKQHFHCDAQIAAAVAPFGLTDGMSVSKAQTIFSAALAKVISLISQRMNSYATWRLALVGDSSASTEAHVYIPHWQGGTNRFENGSQAIGSLSQYNDIATADHNYWTAFKQTIASNAATLLKLQTALFTGQSWDAVVSYYGGHIGI